MLEPQTSAKCVVYTSKGRLNVELWCKEVPKASRAFLEACQLGAFKRESIYEVSDDSKVAYISNSKTASKYLPPENNTRLRLEKNGIFGWDNDSNRWFLTLKECTAEDIPNGIIVGKIVDGSFYTLKSIISDSELTPDGKLVYPAVIKTTEITIPYFTDLPKQVVDKPEGVATTRQKKATKVQLSFDDDDDDDEEELGKEDDTPPLKKMKIKMPSGIKTKDVPALSNDDKGDKDSLDMERGKANEEEIEAHEDCEQAATVSSSTENQTEEEVSLDTKRQTKRELNTLRMLAMFQENIKGKNILKKGK